MRKVYKVLFSMLSDQRLISRKKYLTIIQMMAVTAIPVLALFFWQSHDGFNIWDEGYLWYGVQRVLAGEVPIRDFMAYDPGRYYFSAGLMGLLGDSGLMSLRWTLVGLQMVGVLVSLFLVRKNALVSSGFFLFVASMTFAVWIYPQYKTPDIVASIVLVGALAYMVQKSSLKGYFIAGLFVGLVAVFGRNHGIYGIVGGVGAMGYNAFKNEGGVPLFKSFSMWVFGIVIGFAPVLLMIMFIPGFGMSFLESIQQLFQVKATNLPLPVPWPWLAEFAQWRFGTVQRSFLIGLYFVFILGFGIVGLLWLALRKLKNKPVSSPIVASIFLALPYAHYAYSRADLDHLALGIFPFLISGFAFLVRQPAKIKWSLAALLSFSSIFLMIPFHPGWLCAHQQCVGADVGMDKLNVDHGTASDIAMLKTLVDKFAPNGQAFIATPFWPGAYAVFARKAPMWENFAFFKHSEAFEQAEIGRIVAANPRFAVIYDLPLDSRAELQFANTHPRINQYILDNFEPLTGYTDNPAYRLYRKR
jgi:hypothetical protein